MNKVIDAVKAAIAAGDTSAQGKLNARSTANSAYAARYNAEMIQADLIQVIINIKIQIDITTDIYITYKNRKVALQNNPQLALPGENIDQNILETQ